MSIIKIDGRHAIVSRALEILGMIIVSLLALGWKVTYKLTWLHKQIGKTVR